MSSETHPIEGTIIENCGKGKYKVFYTFKDAYIDEYSEKNGDFSVFVRNLVQDNVLCKSIKVSVFNYNNDNRIIHKDLGKFVKYEQSKCEDILINLLEKAEEDSKIVKPKTRDEMLNRIIVIYNLN